MLVLTQQVSAEHIVVTSITPGFFSPFLCFVLTSEWVADGGDRTMSIRPGLRNARLGFLVKDFVTSA